ncbi:hypothetical protein LCGC14_1102890 [marine sediment metagenome]|uniref:Uncharacterized protein n=1 Tax=marine sediment metagenome TaxID=412755 RepID=A0A0F9M8Y5_9ZZZZ
MPRTTDKTPTPAPEPEPDTPLELNAAQLQQRGRRLAVEHRRLKVAFADTYVELMGVREQNDRLNGIIQEQQRVMHELHEKLPKDEPEATP